MTTWTPWMARPRLTRIAELHASFRLVVALAVAAAGSMASGADPTAGPTPRARTRIVDPAVTTAGGVGCTSCGPAGCRHGHGGRHGHHAGCRDGVCVPYCPVRPQQFGYYGTRWRKWPGQEILQVSGERDAAPAQPPRSAVPGADEESMAPAEPDAAATPDAGAPATLPPQAEEPAPLPSRPRQPEPMPGERAEPRVAPEAKPADEPLPAAQPKPAAEPAPATEPKQALEPKPEAAPKPEAKPEPARPEDENLFEVLSGSGWRAKRKFPVTSADSPAAGSEAGGVRPTAHAAPVEPRSVPKVQFDPAAESRRLRAAR